jgi:hypothetical protein
MTEGGARTTANVVLASAGMAAAVAVLATPPLRRLAAMAIRRWLGASIPIYLLAEARRAWSESRVPG